MNIQVHIERLVVDGLDLGAHHAADLQAALQVHLTRLLKEQGLRGLASASTALSSLDGATVEWAQPFGADLLGKRIAGSVHAGLANLHSPTQAVQGLTGLGDPSRPQVGCVHIAQGSKPQRVGAQVARGIGKEFKI